MMSAPLFCWRTCYDVRIDHYFLSICTLKAPDLATRLDVRLPSPERPLQVSWENPGNCRLWVKRDDLIHPVISGNKWRKLRDPLTDITKQGAQSVLSFGGGYSNHLHSLGFACNQLGIPLTAIVRGDYRETPTPMLHDLISWNTRIEFVDRQTYRKRDEKSYLASLRERYQEPVIIPEGGSQSQAIAGMNAMLEELNNAYDLIVAPVASGGTLAGLIASPASSADILGIAVLKGQGYLESLVEGLLPFPVEKPWSINHDFHHGGYAKSPQALRAFCDSFTRQTSIPVEPVYSGKLFYAVAKMLEKGSFGKNRNILLIHTGGLQADRPH